MIWMVRAAFASAILALLALAGLSYLRAPSVPPRSASQASQAGPVIVAAAPAQAPPIQTPLPQPTATPQTVISRAARVTPTLVSRPIGALGDRPLVNISDAGFAPADLHVKVGTSVTWKNESTQSHDVSLTGAAGGGWTSGLLGPNASAIRAFSVPGQYDYTCSLHAVMRGRIVVEP